MPSRPSPASTRSVARPTTPRVVLTAPTARDRELFLAHVARSRSLHRPWVRPPPTPAAFASYLRRCRSDDFVSYWVRAADDDTLIGVYNISQIFYGSFQSAYMGYYAFADTHGRGLMSAGLRLVLRQIFGPLRLHRIEANIQPQNTASIALVRRAGFQCEGMSRRYLKISGRWRDHERWALLKEDWRRPRTATDA